MSEALQPVISDEARTRCALILSQSYSAPAKLEDAAQELGVSVAEVVTLLNDPSFLELVRGVTRAKATLAIHGPGVNRLADIVTGDDDKLALAAIQTLGKITGDMVNRHAVSVRHTFEDLRKQAVAASDPIGDLFDIRDVIDVEAESD